MVRSGDLVVLLSELEDEDKYHVGDHAANLGKITNAKFSVLPGFVITSNAYFNFLKHNKLDTKISHLIAAMNSDNESSVHQISSYIKKHITTSEIPADIVSQVVDNYLKVGGAGVTIQASVISGDNMQVNVPKILASTITGEAVLLDKMRSYWASLFHPAFMLHRNTNNIEHLKTGIALTVQKAIIPSVLGKVFTINPLTRDKSFAVIEIASNWYIVDKNTSEVTKKHKPNNLTVFVRDGKELDREDALPDHEVIALKNLVQGLEKHYFLGQEIAFAKEGDRFFILGLKPLPSYVQN